MNVKAVLTLHKTIKFVTDPNFQVILGRPRTKMDFRKAPPPFKEDVEIITAPSVFEANSQIDFGRHHLYDHEVKQSRSDPEMTVVSLKQVLKVSPEEAGRLGSVFNISSNGKDADTYNIPPQVTISKKKDTESYISYTGYVLTLHNHGWKSRNDLILKNRSCHPNKWYTCQILNLVTIFIFNTFL